MNEQQLQQMFRTLAVWSDRNDFTAEEWEQYIKTARLVQQADPNTVEAALNQFMPEAIYEEFKGYESESKIFLLMRIVFDLPEVAPEKERFSYKGWANWPEADSNGNVSLAWPLTWQNGKPRLVAPYVGSDGPPYAAVAEYRFLLNHFPYRQLGPEGDPSA